MSLEHLIFYQAIDERFPLVDADSLLALASDTSLGELVRLISSSYPDVGENEIFLELRRALADDGLVASDSRAPQLDSRLETDLGFDGL